MQIFVLFLLCTTIYETPYRHILKNSYIVHIIKSLFLLFQNFYQEFHTKSSIPFSYQNHLGSTSLIEHPVHSPRGLQNTNPRFCPGSLPNQRNSIQNFQFVLGHQRDTPYRATVHETPSMSSKGSRRVLVSSRGESRGTR